MRGLGTLLLTLVVIGIVGFLIVGAPVLAVPVAIVAVLAITAVRLRGRIVRTAQVKGFREQASDLEDPPRERDGRDHSTLYEPD